MPYCPECGEEVEEDQKYCSNCGEELNKEDQGGSSHQPEENTEKENNSSSENSPENSPPPSLKSVISNNKILLLIVGGFVAMLAMNAAKQPLNEDTVSVRNVEWIDPQADYMNTYDNGSPRYYGEVEFTLKASEDSPNNFVVRIPSRQNYEQAGIDYQYKNVYLSPGQTERVTVKTGERGLKLILKRSIEGEREAVIRPDIRDPNPQELPPELRP